MQNESNQWCDVASYFLGQNYWYGGVTGAITYKANLTSIRPFMLIANLRNTYLSPVGLNYTNGSFIPLRMYVTDDCNVNITNALVIFNLTSGSYSTAKSVTTAGGDEYVNISYKLPNDAPYGWYNVTVESSKANHWNKTINQLNAFYYGSAITLSNQIMSPGNGGWGESPFTFNVTVNNAQATTAYLWLKNSTSNEVYEYDNTCITCNNYLVNYNKTFTCSNIDSWAFRYNASDLFVNVYNGSRFIENNELINSTGEYYYLDFDPTCNYQAGTQNWNYNVTSAICYKNQNSQTFVV